MSHTLFAAAVVALGLAGSFQDAPVCTPLPQKEHEYLRFLEGDWDAACRFIPDPMEPALESVGHESARVMLGGFWVNFEFHGEHEGMPFEGRGSLGYDAEKRKYVATWIESRSSVLLVSEGDIDVTGKVVTVVGSCPDPLSGKLAPQKWVFDIKSAQTRTSTFYMPGPDGMDRKVAEITYTKRSN